MKNQIENLTDPLKEAFANRFIIASKNRRRVEHLLQLAIRHFTVEGLQEADLDSTGILYAEKLRNKFSALIMNSNYIWAYIEPPRWVEASDGDKAIFEKHTETVFDIIQEGSNFELEKAKILSDYLIGTTALKINFTGNLIFPAEVEHCSLSSIFLGNDRKGKPGDVFYLKKGASKYTLSDTYGKDVLLQPAIKAIGDQDEFDFYEATILYDGKVLYAASLDGSFKNTFYFEEMEYNPWVIGRCELLPGSPYGCGPCIKACMELLALKNKKKNLDKVGTRLASPAYIGYGDVKDIKRSRVSKPDTISIFRNRSTSIEPVNYGNNVEVETFNIQEHKEVLREIFYIDFISAITDVDSLKNVTATATQVAVAKFAEQIEPMYSMVQKELLKGIVMKTYECCLRANLLSTDDIEYLKNNTRTSLRFYNAITMAQEQKDLQRASMYIQDIFTKWGHAGVASAIKEEAHIDELMRRYRVSVKEFNTGKEMAAKMNEILQQTQQVQTPQGGM